MSNFLNSMSHPQRTISQWLKVILLTGGILVTHWGLAFVSQSVSFENGASAIWPSSGFYLALVWLGGYKIALPILLSELIVNRLLFYQDIFTIIGISFIGTIEPIITGWLLRRFLAPNRLFMRSRNVLKFIILILPSPVITTSLAVAILCFTKQLPWEFYSAVWTTWSISVITGRLIITPAILAWKSPALHQSIPITKKQLVLELGIVISLLLGISYLAFWVGHSVEYMMLPLLLWAGFRFRAREATLLVILISALATWGTARGLGAFVQDNIVESFWLLQSFISVVTLTTYLLVTVIAENRQGELKLKDTNQALENAFAQLKTSQLQLVQNEKMAALGNLVAGVAHEINNPIGFLNGSINNAQEYVQDIFGHLATYQQHQPPQEPVQENAVDIELEFIQEDLPKLLDAMQNATDRIKSISNSLRIFSRADTEHKVSVNLHDGLDSALLILKYRLKGNNKRPAIKIVKKYGEVSALSCFPGQLNQVFMNILANAIDMFDDMAQQSSFAELETKPQKITIQTATLTQQNAISIQISDNGKGMTPAIQARIFDHLFTTKGVGQGTGLGLAIAHQIITENHQGKLWCESQLGQGTTFYIELLTA